MTSNWEVARCVLNNEKQRCINIVEKYIASVIRKEFSFGKRNSERMWKFLGEFYVDILPNSFKQSETSVTESSSTPLKLSSLTKSINEIGSADSKKRKERDHGSSVRVSAYELQMTSLFTKKYIRLREKYSPNTCSDASQLASKMMAGTVTVIRVSLLIPFNRRTKNPLKE